eukprot:scaffold207_cov345-Pavlova_lutheri.AAC.10
MEEQQTHREGEPGQWWGDEGERDALFCRNAAHLLPGRTWTCGPWDKDGRRMRATTAYMRYSAI